jgi:hypothetical protein
MKRNALVLGALVALAARNPEVEAFCGFYVSGSNQKLFNDATNVVLMRSGTRTVLAMQNDYRGPLEDFAMIVPVPVVLKPSDVKVVPKQVFDRIDALGSPRLVEYWEEDPCPSEYGVVGGVPGGVVGGVAGVPVDPPSRPQNAPPVARYEKQREPERKAVPPILASFDVKPPSVTAGIPTDLTWTYRFANEPWPPPACTVDNKVGAIAPHTVRTHTLDQTTTFTLTCANSAGRATKQAKINVVKIEAKFDVAEYQILILSATEAAGLDQWLRINKYKIPEDAEPLLRPYIESGSKFFVARVDPKKVKMVDGRVALSPLRFHYDHEEFSLPIRLGLANSSGKQDLIVSIVSPDRRYEVANYKNVTIPTNFDVKPIVKHRFAEFYAALFDKTIERNPGAVVTEYAWTAHETPQFANGSGKCDPCPPEVPLDADMMQLGADVIGGRLQRGNYVLTRLHARYGKADMKDDLRFREATPIVGGRETPSQGKLEQGSSSGPVNYFQARYAIRNWWTGPINCQHPTRGVWGGPPNGRANQVIAATKTAFAPRGKLQLASVIKRDISEIGVKKAPDATKPAPTQPSGGKKVMWIGAGLLLGVTLLALGRLVRR